MSYEYNAPQFVDFLSNELNNLSIASPRNEVFESSSSPAVKRVLGIGYSKFPHTIQKNFRNANLVSSVKKNVNFSQLTNATDSVKLTTKKVLSKRLSKSTGAINVPSGPLQAKKKLEYLPKPKRSLSENDLRPRKKCRATATTPMCLKRTIQNVKNKKLKTTEEMELEKIAELQMQTRKHLRANEVTMRRLKIGHPQKALVETQKKPPVTRERIPVKNPQPATKSVFERLNTYAANARTKVPAPKNENAVKKPSNVYIETMKKIDRLRQSAAGPSNNFIRGLLTPITSQQIPEDSCARMSIAAVMKELPVKKEDSHRGIMFNSSQRKLNIRPFNFQNSIQSTVMNPTLEKGKSVMAVNDTFQTPRLVRDKENNGAWKR